MFHCHHLVAGLLLACGVVADLGGGWFGYDNARWSECTNLESTCKPTISSCASYLCGQCYAFGGSGFKSCCQQTPAYECFRTAAGGGGGGGGSAIVTTPPPVTDSNLLVCQTAAGIVTSCESATPGFDTLDDDDAASCYCYSGADWQPDVFDGAWSSCIAYASTADASDYSDFASAAGFCSSVGDVRNTPASTPATTTSAAAAGGTKTSSASTGSKTTTASAATTSASKSAAARQVSVGMAFQVFAAVSIAITGATVAF